MTRLAVLLAALALCPAALATGSPYPLEESTGPCADRGGVVGQATTIYRDGRWFHVWTCAEGGTDEEEVFVANAAFVPDPEPVPECSGYFYDETGWNEEVCP